MHSRCNVIESQIQLFYFAPIECLQSILVPAPCAQVRQVQLRHFSCRFLLHYAVTSPDLPWGSLKTRVQNGSYVELLPVMSLHLSNKFVVAAQCRVTGLKALRLMNDENGMRSRQLSPGV